MDLIDLLGLLVAEYSFVIHVPEVLDAIVVLHESHFRRNLVDYLAQNLRYLII